MMKYVTPSTIRGTIKAPASKSMMQRAIAAALLSDDPVTISNPTYSNDSKSALAVVRGMGAEVTVNDDEIHIKGGINPRTDTLVVGESGLGIRMFTPIAALWHKPLTVTGEGSLLSRPVSMMEEPLTQLGVGITTSNGCPPLTVTGPLQGGVAEVDGSVSSQFLTGLLMALPKARTESHLQVKDLKSTPYIDMTLALLKDFGIKVSHWDYRTFTIPGNQTYRPVNDSYWVEGDWSGAAFLLVAGAVAGAVTVTGLDRHSTQADCKIMEALEAAGASIDINDAGIHVRSNPLTAFEFDATHCPDLFPPLVALACNCEGTTVLTGVERLTHKESNRAVALEKEFSALGGEIFVHGNRMEITGKPLTGGEIDSHNDHRIAMAAAIAALNAASTVAIKGYQCVAKSYPAFFDDLQAIGGRIDE